jgi:N-acetylglucosaminyldiphosphoundecaprenol N-acetyl-beta-D-mannosaminyltransferase
MSLFETEQLGALVNGDKFQLAGVKFDSVTTAQTVEFCIQAAAGKGQKFIVTGNVDHIVLLQDPKQAIFRECYANANLSVADGMPIVWASKILSKKPLPERVSGADLFPLICERAAQTNLRVFLLGAAEGVADKAAEKLKLNYPNIQVCGTYSPPMGFEKNPTENNKILNIVNASNADILFLSFGSPKGENWIWTNRTQLNVGLLVSVGAAIPFYAGTEARAPLWMQSSGLEWLYRILKEPKRLGMRYVKDFVIFKLFFQQLLREGFRK